MPLELALIFGNTVYLLCFVIFCFSRMNVVSSRQVLEYSVQLTLSGLLNEKCRWVVYHRLNQLSLGLVVCGYCGSRVECGPLGLVVCGYCGSRVECGPLGLVVCGYCGSRVECGPLG